jgi:metal-responsive CopG/Arc/MetJ family transcriptional regulator
MQGRPATGKGTPILVRLQPDQLEALDSWIAEQPEKLTRAEAIRRILRKAIQ